MTRPLPWRNRANCPEARGRRADDASRSGALCKQRYERSACMDILLKGGVGLIAAALAMAWLGTFARWFPVRGVDGGFVKSYDTLVKAHLDFLLMALFCLAFYATRLPIPAAACWLVVIGGFTNPGVFVIVAFLPDAWSRLWMRLYTGASFLVTTIGFGWSCQAMLAAL
jgi:hypothetical protein